mmetsp:Transcript_29840/g.62776  ORF Transcript_29840/g.62776 Transcript_29840/m.62776 type:complete len:229 (-) Transcript_29840:569-1255(-)
MRKDGHFPIALQVLQLRRHRLRRMRRARKRDGGSAVRFPRVDHDHQRRGRQGKGSRDHETHHFGRQHFQHACGCPRSFHLHRYHPRRVFPRPGNERVHDGGLHLSMGRSPSRDLGSTRRDARRFRISRLPRSPSRCLLRASRSRVLSRISRSRGYRHCRWGRLSPRRRFLRSRHRRHSLHRPSLLGVGQEACSEKALSFAQLAHLLHQIHASSGALLQQHGPALLLPP